MAKGNSKQMVAVGLKRGRPDKSKKRVIAVKEEEAIVSVIDDVKGELFEDEPMPPESLPFEEVSPSEPSMKLDRLIPVYPKEDISLKIVPRETFPVQTEENESAKIIQQQGEMIVSLQRTIDQLSANQQELASIVQQVLLTSANQNLAQSKELSIPSQSGDLTDDIEHVAGMPQMNSMVTFMNQAAPLVQAAAQLFSSFNIGRQQQQALSPDPEATFAAMMKPIDYVLRMQEASARYQDKLASSLLKNRALGVDEDVIVDKVTKGVLAALTNYAKHGE